MPLKKLLLAKCVNLVLQAELNKRRNDCCPLKEGCDDFDEYYCTYVEIGANDPILKTEPPF